MRFNALDLIQSSAVAWPVFAMLLVALAGACIRLKQRVQKSKRSLKSRVIVTSATAAIGLGFLPLAFIYRPNLIEVTKAQIREQEHVDEDDSGAPETPRKHLHRQLRRIRKGENVETLILRRE